MDTPTESEYGVAIAAASAAAAAAAMDDHEMPRDQFGTGHPLGNQFVLDSDDTAPSTVQHVYTRPEDVILRGLLARMASLEETVRKLAVGSTRATAPMGQPRRPSCQRCSRSHLRCSHETPCAPCTKSGHPCVYSNMSAAKKYRIKAAAKALAKATAKAERATSARTRAGADALVDTTLSRPRVPGAHKRAHTTAATATSASATPDTSASAAASAVASASDPTTTPKKRARHA